ncbi:MAG TPA: hypothetical protein VIA63_09810 [Candidatus Limnocylindria bacterium]
MEEEPGPNDSWIRFEFARHVHAYLQDQIRLSDTKAGAAAAVAGVLVGAFRQLTVSGAPLSMSPRNLSGALEALTAALFVLFSLLVVLNAYKVLRPRTPGPAGGPHHRFVERLTDLFDRESQPSGEGELVSWTALESRGPEARLAYTREVEAASPTKLTGQLLAHASVLALLAGQKHRHARFALNDLLLATICFLLLGIEVAILPGA